MEKSFKLGKRKTKTFIKEVKELIAKIHLLKKGYAEENNSNYEWFKIDISHAIKAMLKIKEWISNHWEEPKKQEEPEGNKTDGIVVAIAIDF